MQPKGMRALLISKRGDSRGFENMDTALEHETYLTPAMLRARYQNSVTLRTLANWRSCGDGPRYTKIGGRVLYPLREVLKWENTRTIGRVA